MSLFDHQQINMPIVQEIEGSYVMTRFIIFYIPILYALIDDSATNNSTVFSHCAVVFPSSIPSVLSGIKRIFTVAKMIFQSSASEGWAMYIRSISSLS